MLCNTLGFLVERWGRAVLAVVAALATVVGAANAQGEESLSAVGVGLVASPEPDWPQWRGPRRDGISREAGLLDSWPSRGPELLWTSTGLGRGYSAPILVKQRIYLTGDVEDELRIFALDDQGRKIWETGNGRAWRTPYPGARAACTYSEGRLYHLNAHGRLVCLDADTGDEVWAFNIFERFGGKNITWALSECVVVDGPRVIVTPGGTRALMAALDKRTGETLWMTEPLRLGPSPSPDHQRLANPPGETDNASYTSPVLLNANGRRLLVSCSLRHAFGVDAESGQLLWTRPLETRHGVIAAMPVLVDDAVFVTAPDTEEGGLLLRLGTSSSEPAVEDIWKSPLDTCHGGAVRVGDSLVGSWYRRQKGWACVDIASGQVRYSLEDLAKGSVLYADERFYVLSEEGEMALLRTGAGEFEVTGRFPLVEGRVRDAWTHPVILHGRLYLRYHETLYCYRVQSIP